MEDQIYLMSEIKKHEEDKKSTSVKYQRFAASCQEEVVFSNVSA